jgi:hypothetical protein
MSVDVLQVFYDIAAKSLFPSKLVVLKDDNVKINRKNNISFFFSNFYSFYTHIYPVIKPICVSEMNNSSRGPVSYTINANTRLNIKEDLIHRRTYSNSDKVFAQDGGDNILIVGAGPIGLYLAGLLKICAPHIEINIIEKRVSDDKQRALTRIGKLVLRSAYVYNTFYALDKMNELFSKACPILQELLIGIDPESKNASLILLNNIRSEIFTLTSGTEQTYSINRVELLLANFAQRCGVNIYHDNKINSIEYIESNYVNKNTKYVFDATGGRLIKSREINAQFHNTRTVPRNFDEILNRKREEGIVGDFIVKEGYLTPEQAVYRRNGYIYAAIGETFIKTDYKESKSIVFGAAMSIGLVLLVLRELLDSKKGGTRKTRKNRK